MRERYVFVAMMALLSIICAQEIQGFGVNLNVSGVGTFVNVTNNFNRTSLLPTYEYTSTVTLNWIIPQDALVNMTAGKVFVFVAIDVKDTSPFVYFKAENGEPAATVTTILRCDITDSTCGASSILLKNIPFYIKLNESGVYDSDAFDVRASLAPFGPFSTLTEEITSLNQTSVSLLQEIQTLNSSVNDTTVLIERLEVVNESLKEYSTAGIADELQAIRDMISNLRTQNSYFSRIQAAQLALPNVNLTQEDLVLLADIQATLGNAWKATDAMEFTTAENMLASAQNKTVSLQKLMAEEKKTATDSISGYLSKNWTLTTFIGIVILVALFYLAMRLTKGESKEKKRSPKFVYKK
jgi:hypothetical protein